MTWTRLLASRPCVWRAACAVPIVRREDSKATLGWGLSVLIPLPMNMLPVLLLYYRLDVNFYFPSTTYMHDGINN